MASANAAEHPSSQGSCGKSLRPNTENPDVIRPCLKYPLCSEIIKLCCVTGRSDGSRHVDGAFRLSCVVLCR